MNKRINLDLEEVAKRLEALAHGIRNISIRSALLDRATRGDREKYDFTGTGKFYREHYPKLKEFFYEIRGKGILGEHISEED